MNILEELYNGNICPVEKFAKKGGEYQKLMIQLSDCVDKLMLMLSDDGIINADTKTAGTSPAISIPF